MHDFRRENDLSCHEYILCDMIYFLSTHPNSRIPGWCYASKDKLADEILIGRQTLFNILERMIEAGFIIRDEETKYLKTSDKWNKVYIKSDSTESVLSVQKIRKRSTETVLQSSTETVLNINNNNNNINNSTSLTGSLFADQEEKVSTIVNKQKEKRKKVAAKKEKAPPDPAYNPCKDIWNDFMKSHGYVPDFRMNGRAITEFIAYLRVFILQKEGHDPDPEYVVEVFKTIFDKRNIWGKFESTLYEMTTINKFKATIVGNVFRGGPPSKEKKVTAEELKEYDDLS